MSELKAIGAFCTTLGVVGILAAASDETNDYKEFGWLSAVVMAVGMGLLAY